MTLSGMTFKLNGATFHIPVLGRHFLNAAAISIAIATEFGMELDEIQAGLAHFKPESGRCAMKSIGDWTIIDDTYNASPRSMHAACRLLADWPEDRSSKVLVAGDMLELGESAIQYHQHLGRTVADSGIDFLITHGQYAETLASSAIMAGLSPHQVSVCNDLESIQLNLDCRLAPNSVVLVKGSRAMKMERVVEAIQNLAAHTTFPAKQRAA